METDQHDKMNQQPDSAANSREHEEVKMDPTDNPPMGAKNQKTSYKGMTEETNTLTEKSGGAMQSPVNPKDENKSGEEVSETESEDDAPEDEVDEFSDEDEDEVNEEEEEALDEDEMKKDGDKGKHNQGNFIM